MKKSQLGIWTSRIRRKRDIQEETEENRLYATKAANKWG